MVAVRQAASLGIDVVITDHHEAIGDVPPAIAVCNAAALAPDDPLYALPGSAMAYLLARLLCARAGRAEEAHDQLDLVALGIVAMLQPTCAGRQGASGAWPGTFMAGSSAGLRSLATL